MLLKNGMTVDGGAQRTLVVIFEGLKLLIELTLSMNYLCTLQLSKQLNFNMNNSI